MPLKLFSPVVLGLACMSISGLVSAQEPAAPAVSVEERITRLERLMNSQGLVDILLRMENLQRDVQQIQGGGEVQLHKLEEIKKRQRELYIDIDRRLLQLERKQTTAMPAQVSKQPVTSTPSQTKKGMLSVDNEAATAGSTMASGKPTGRAVRSSIPAKQEVTQPTPETEQTAYQKAFDLLRELRYDKASEAFRTFINNYPEGRYAHIAQYWLAEASYAQRDFKTAIGDYTKLIDTYAASPKRAEAMLKIGYSYYELKDYPMAQSILEQLIGSYPDTTESGQARNLLQKIKINNAS
ncbi:MAG: tol-pal system protein YbgF [Gammaproteobacteria bacterium]|nr:tol-pal system protein YbgF [Gammaproteobacteria bacterium]